MAVAVAAAPPGPCSLARMLLCSRADVPVVEMSSRSLVRSCLRLGCRMEMLSGGGFAQCLRQSSSCRLRVLGQGGAGGERPAAPSAILSREQTETCLQPPVCWKLRENFLCLKLGQRGGVTLL